MTTKAQPRAVRLPFTLVVGVENDLDTRIDALGVRGQKIPQPASDFLVGPAGKHGGILAPGDRSDHLPVREAASESWCVLQAVAELGPRPPRHASESWCVLQAVAGLGPRPPRHASESWCVLQAVAGLGPRPPRHASESWCVLQAVAGLGP